jgi:hypothetical protein
MRTCVNLHSAEIIFAGGTAFFLGEGLGSPHKGAFHETAHTQHQHSAPSHPDNAKLESARAVITKTKPRRAKLTASLRPAWSPGRLGLRKQMFGAEQQVRDGRRGD